MQKQNQFRFFVPDRTLSFPDENDHQNVNYDFQNFTHNSQTNNTRSLNNIVSNNNNTNNNNIDHNNNNFSSNIHNNDNNIANIGSAIQESFHSSNSFIDDSGIFTDYILDEVRNRDNDFEPEDVDDDKYFQPIPPSPFIYEEETTQDYNNNDTVYSVSKSVNDDNDDLDSFGLDSCTPTLPATDDDFCSFTPLESTIGLDFFDRMSRHDAREVDSRSESFSSSMLSEHYSSFVLDEDKDDLNFDDSGEQTEKCLEMNYSGNDGFNDGTSGNEVISTSQSELNQDALGIQEGPCTRYGVGFGGNTGCYNDYLSFDLDGQGNDFMASSRKRIPSGDGTFNSNTNNSPHDDQNAISRKRIASGDSSSNNRIKISRSGSSLDEEPFSSVPLFTPNTQNDIASQSTSNSVTHDLSGIHYFSENMVMNSNNQILDTPERHLAGNETLFPPVDSLNPEMDQNWTVQKDMDQYSGLVVPKLPSSSENSVFKRPNIDRMLCRTNDVTPAVPNVYSLNTINNNVLNDKMYPYAYNNNNCHQLPLLPHNNDDIMSTHVSMIPSSQTPSFLIPPQQAANHGYNSHPSTVRPSSAATICNEITSPFDFNNPHSTRRTSLPEAFRNIQEESVHYHNNASRGFINKQEAATDSSGLSVGNSTETPGQGIQSNSNENNFQLSFQELKPVTKDDYQTSASVNDDILSSNNFHNEIDYVGVPVNSTPWTRNDFLYTGTTVITTTNTDANCNSANNISDNSQTHGNIYTVQDLIHNSNTIGFSPERVRLDNPSTPVDAKRQDLLSDPQTTLSTPIHTNTVVDRSNTHAAVNTPIPPHMNTSECSLTSSKTSNSIIDSKAHVLMEMTHSNVQIPETTSLPTFSGTSDSSLSYINNSSNESTPILSDIKNDNDSETFASVAAREEHGTTQTPGIQNENQHGVKYESSTDDPALEKAFNECLRTGSQTCLIKEELKRKILYKRCVQGQQDVPSDPVRSPSSNQLTEDEMIKRKRRLEANRLAAAKMRTRKKEQQEGLNLECQLEEDKRAKLQAEVKKLEDQREKMLLLLSHVGICIDTSTRKG